MTDGRCEACRYWKDPRFASKVLPKGRGVCAAIVPDGEDPVAIYTNDDPSGVWLETTAEFGCTQWEARRPA